MSGQHCESYDAKRETVHCYPVNSSLLTAVTRDGWNLSAVFKFCFCFVLLYNKSLKVDGTSFQVFWICKLWKERTKSQLNVITKFVNDSIAKLVLVQKRQLFCHQLLPGQRYLMIVQTYFWASKAHILKTNLVTPNFFHISFFVILKWNYMMILKNFYEADFL